MHKLTRISNIWSMVIAVDGDDHIIQFSGESWQNTTDRLARFGTPLDAWILQNATQDEERLLFQSIELGAVSTVGPNMNYGERTMVMRRRWRRIERQRECGAASGFFNSALGKIYRAKGRSATSSLRWQRPRCGGGFD
jgi:hypothetical protein